MTPTTPCSPSSTPTPTPKHHAASPTAHLLDELALYGYRPGQDEPDPRPLPEPEMAQAQLADIVDAFGAMLADTRLEDDLPDLLWSFVNLFHRKIDRVERDLDDQRAGAAPQPGRAERLRGQVGRARAADRPGHRA